VKRLVALVLLLAGACGNEAAPGASGDEVLGGRTFLSESVDGRQLVPDTQVRLTFNPNGTVGASAGCNQFVGTVDYDGDRLVVTDIGGTEMGCDEARHAQDEWLVTFLESGPSWNAPDGRGGRLTLTASGVTIRLVDRAVVEPDLPLVDTRWVVDTVLGPDAASSVPPGVEAFLRFSGTRLEGHDGCNGFGADVVVDDPKGTIRVGERTQTLIGCPPEVMRVADAVAAATIGTSSYRIEGRRLTLTDADGRGISASARP